MFIDSDFHCHATNPDGVYREFDEPFFYGKCTEFIESYMYVPEGEVWTRSDGKTFNGKMITPWKDSSKLDNVQRKYEKQLLADYESALSEIEAALGV